MKRKCVGDDREALMRSAPAPLLPALALADAGHVQALLLRLRALTRAPQTPASQGAAPGTQPFCLPPPT